MEPTVAWYSANSLTEAVLHSCSIECQCDLPGIATVLPERYPYLLDSAASGPLSEHSLLLRTSGEQLCLRAGGQMQGPGACGGFLDRLEHWFQQEQCTTQQSTTWPFSGGWFLYLGYELAAEIEPVVNFPRAGDGFPVAFASRCPAVVYSCPSQPGVLQLVAESEELLNEMREELESLAPLRIKSTHDPATLTEDPPETFKEAINRIHEYILDGDVFQVNLSRGWQGEFEVEPDVGPLYRSLCRNNPAPFAGMVRWKDYVLMSSSPERLVNTRKGEVQSRPIAGTRPRGTDGDSDLALSEELLTHPKERAEHIMLIDLVRNDLGRVCKTGTVSVDELMVVESYEHVHHIVSNIRGDLREDVTPVDVIRAVFPGGTITGCPKVRCMEIIAELEKKGRSFYTGSFGYLGLDGSMDLNILIRSMLLKDKRVCFRTGAGIVTDSDPDGELLETGDKARGLIRALGSAQGQTHE